MSLKHERQIYHSLDFVNSIHNFFLHALFLNLQNHGDDHLTESCRSLSLKEINAGALMRSSSALLTLSVCTLWATSPNCFSYCIAFASLSLSRKHTLLCVCVCIQRCANVCVYLKYSLTLFFATSGT